MELSGRQITMVWARGRGNVVELRNSAMFQLLLEPMYLHENSDAGFVQKLGALLNNKNSCNSAQMLKHFDPPFVAPIVLSETNQLWMKPTGKLQVLLAVAILACETLEEIPHPVRRLMASCGVRKIRALNPLWKDKWSRVYSEVHSNAQSSMDIHQIIHSANMITMREQHAERLAARAAIAEADKRSGREFQAPGNGQLVPCSPRHTEHTEPQPQPKPKVQDGMEWHLWHELLFTYMASCAAMPMFMQPRAVDTMLFPKIVSYIFDEDIIDIQPSSTPDGGSIEIIRTPADEFEAGTVKAALALRSFFVECRRAGVFVAPTRKVCGEYTGIIRDCAPHIMNIVRDPIEMCNAIYDAQSDNDSVQVHFIKFQAVLMANVIRDIYKQFPGNVHIVESMKQFGRVFRAFDTTTDDVKMTLSDAGVNVPFFVHTSLDLSSLRHVTYLCVEHNTLRFINAAVHIASPLSHIDNPAELLDVFWEHRPDMFRMLLERVSPSDTCIEAEINIRVLSLLTFAAKHSISRKTQAVIAAIMFTPAEDMIWMKADVAMSLLKWIKNNGSQHSGNRNHEKAKHVVAMIDRMVTNQLAACTFDCDEVKSQTLHRDAETRETYVSFSHAEFSEAMERCENQKNVREVVYAAVRSPNARIFDEFSGEFPVTCKDRVRSLLEKILSSLTRSTGIGDPRYKPQVLDLTSTKKLVMELPLFSSLTRGFESFTHAREAPIARGLLATMTSLVSDLKDEPLPGESFYSASLGGGDNDSPMYNPTSPRACSPLPPHSRSDAETESFNQFYEQMNQDTS